MAKDTQAANAAITSPAFDSNVWRDIMLSLAAGVLARFPDAENSQAAHLDLYGRVFEDGLLEKAKRAMKLAVSLQEVAVKLEKEGEV
jgi:hypothetical protein